jgi:hypothetical protein
VPRVAAPLGPRIGAVLDPTDAATARVLDSPGSPANRADRSDD